MALRYYTYTFKLAVVTDAAGTQHIAGGEGQLKKVESVLPTGVTKTGVLFGKDVEAFGYLRTSSPGKLSFELCASGDAVQSLKEELLKTKEDDHGKNSTLQPTQ